MTGDGQVERVEIAQVDKQFQPIPGTERILEADTVCLAVGLNPMTELVWTAGCKFCFIPAFGGHVPMHDGNMETTVPGLYVAGDVTGVEEASSAMEEGNLAGVCAAHALGLLTDEQAADKKARLTRVWTRCAPVCSASAAARLNSSSPMPCRPNKERTIMWGDPNKLSRDNLQKEDINPGVQYTGVPSQDELPRCPGLAITILDRSYSDTEATIDFPFEYLPLPAVGDQVDAVDRAGQVVCKGRIVRVLRPASYAGTAVICMAIPHEYIDRVRSMKRLPRRD